MVGLPDCHCTIADGFRSCWADNPTLNALLPAEDLYDEGVARRADCNCYAVIRQTGNSVLIARFDDCEIFQTSYEIVVRCKRRGVAQGIVSAMVAANLPCFCATCGTVESIRIGGMFEEHTPPGSEWRRASAVLLFRWRRDY